MNPQNKKFLFIAGGVFVLFLIVVIVIAVSSGSKKSNTTQSLTFWQYSDENTAYDNMISDFERENKIKVNIVKKDLNGYLEEALNQIAAGKGPDVWEVPNDWMVTYKDKMVPMTKDMLGKKNKTDAEVYQDKYPDVVSQDNVFDSKIYGIPLSIDTLSLYYNQDIFNNTLSDYRKAHQDEDIEGVRRILTDGPKNWDEFVVASRLTTKKSGSDITQSGVAFGTPETPESVDVLTALMLQNGVKMTSDDNSIAQFHTQQNVFSGESFPGTKALEFFTSFANQNNENYTWNNALGDGVRAFADGKAAMLIGYPSAKSDITRINSKLQYNTINLPQIKETKNLVNFASYPVYTVTKATKSSELAWKFVSKFANQLNVNYFMQSTKKTPALKTSVEENAPVLTAQNWYKPDPEKTDSVFNDMIKQVNDGKNAQTAIENAASQVTTLLEKLK